MLLRLALIAAALLTGAPAAWAACANPTGVTGEIVFNQTHSVIQFCNASGNWVALGGNGNDGSGETDPQVGTLTEGKWCTASGGTVTCTSDAPLSSVALDDLTDVDTSGVATGNVIAYNGASWVVSSSVSALNDLSDATITTATSGDLLYYNGSAWVNQASSGLFSADRITSSTTAAIIANSATGYISLTANASTAAWGYLGASATYLPILNVGAISVSTNRTSVTTLYASGKVGIATATPSTTLTVSGTTSTNAINFKAVTGGAAPSSYLGGHWTTTPTGIYYNSGNVGIGTSSPDSALTLQGSGSAPTLLNVGGSSNGAILARHIDGKNYNSAAYDSLFLNYNAGNAVYVGGAAASPTNLYIPHGNVGIGTATPSDMLHIASTAGPRIRLQDTGDSGDAAASWLEFRDSAGTRIGYVGDGSVTGQHIIIASDNADVRALGIGGSCYVNTGGCTSDRRLKQDIQPLTGSLEKLAKISGVSFEWKKHPGEHYFGFIAQNVEEQFPTLVKTDEEGWKSVNYNGMTAPMVEAIKELKIKNDALEADNVELRTRLQKIEQKLNMAN